MSVLTALALPADVKVFSRAKRAEHAGFAIWAADVSRRKWDKRCSGGDEGQYREDFPTTRQPLIPSNVTT